MTALGINIYGGSFTLGVQKHFKILGQWEECALGKKTFDLNFKNIYRPLNYSEWPVEKTKVNFLYANPPCRPWSIASVTPGRTKADMFKDKRLLFTEHTMTTALKIEPDIFICESVENAYNIGKSYYDTYAEKWMQKGYSVTYFLNDGLIQGLPSIRRRFHFIASHYELQLADKPGKFKVKTVKDAIGDLLEINNQIPQHIQSKGIKGFDHLLIELPEYTDLRKYIKKLSINNVPGCNFYTGKLAWNWPARTMVGFDYIHPVLNRWLTCREALRLCSYPDSFICHDIKGAIDAVLPVVAEFLALTAKKTLEKADPVFTPELKVIDWRPFAKPYYFNRKDFL